MKGKGIFVTVLLLISCMFSFAACGGQTDTDTGDGLENKPPVYESEEFNGTNDRHDSFVDNQVLITLTEEVTFDNIFHDYTVEDFSGIGAIDVEEIDGRVADSPGITYRIRQCLLEDPSGETIPEHLKHYKRIFCITLDKKDKDNVLRIVDILEQRTDVYRAGTNGINEGA